MFTDFKGKKTTCTIYEKILCMACVYILIDMTHVCMLVTYYLVLVFVSVIAVLADIYLHWLQ